MAFCPPHSNVSLIGGIGDYVYPKRCTMVGKGVRACHWEFNFGHSHVNDSEERSVRNVGSQRFRFLDSLLRTCLLTEKGQCSAATRDSNNYHHKLTSWVSIPCFCTTISFINDRPMLFVIALYDEYRVLTSATTALNFMNFASSVLWDTGLRLRLCHEK